MKAAVAFRYGSDIGNWDLQLHHLVFKYTLADGWQLLESYPVTSPAMINPFTAQTHPDIAYDQASGDVYCAWTEIIAGVVTHVVYQRFSGDPPNCVGLFPFLLDFPGMAGGWFVSLDVGRIKFPWTPIPERVVAFAYTAQQPGNFPGLHPVVGWWNIDMGPDDNSHEPNHILIDDYYWPTPGSPHHTGMIRIDIPCDNAPGHGGAAVFVTDTEVESIRYQVYGISSLYPLDYTLISAPGCGPFDQGTLPSIAIHNETGTTASVTYLARKWGDPWSIWATHWEIDSPHLSGATPVDTAASGDFELNVDNLLNYDWGTSSSLVMIGDNTYWAAWSDHDLDTVPTRVFGSMGIADP